MIKNWDAGTKDWFFSLSPATQSKVLFLEEHPDYPAYFLVSGIDATFLHIFKDYINMYAALPKFKIKEFLDKTREEDYELILIGETIDELQSFLSSLERPYPHQLNITLKSFQLRGWNYIKDLPSAIINWSTGTGKSVLAIAQTKHLLETRQVDKVLVLSKRHNKINWQRSMVKFANLHSVTDNQISTGNAQLKREQRKQLYHDNTIIIINYEKLDGDYSELDSALKGQRVLWIWDEMPNKMKSMRTRWYKAAERLLAHTANNRQLELTAKKLDTDPENVYSCTKILDKTVWPNLVYFRSLYAKSMSPFNEYKVATWNHEALPELGMRLSHMTHIVNKYTDPEVMKEFPEDHWEDIYIDMSNEDRKLYNKIKAAIIEDIEAGVIEHVSPLQTILPLQLMCMNPLLINKSESKLAINLRQIYKFTDKSCAKLETLKDLLDQIEGKVVIFSALNEYGSRMLVPYLNKWGYSYVLYDGSEKQMQKAQDLFQNNPWVKIFLSSDKGSDSINLEQATSVINYDLPWNYSTLTQRVNRISRLTSTADHVWFYNLIVADSIEEKKLKILEKKKRYEDLIDVPLEDQSAMVNSGFLADILS